MRMIVVLFLMALGRPALGQSCVASATGESFGSYNPFSGMAATSTATLSVTCQSAAAVLVSYTIALGAGGGGTVAARSMGGGASQLPYQLYRDIAHTQIWGDGTGGSQAVTDSYLLSVVTPVIRTYAAYGLIPAGMSGVTPGLYGDTVTVLLSY